jgi:hypothetical protein
MRNPVGLKQWTLAAVLLLAAVLSVLSVVDDQARDDYESLFQRAFVTFALARTLNGVISAVQGTELALQPAGVGVTLTPGEILDPVNDLVERFSWIMLGATVSLGIQRVLMDVSAWWVLQALVALLAIWLLVACLAERPRGGGRRRILARVFLFALFLRFAVPLTLIANDALYGLFLEPRYAASTAVIESAGADLEELGRDDPKPSGEEGGLFADGFLGYLGRAVDSTREVLDLGERVQRVKRRAAEVVEHIAFLWVFLQLAKWLFRPISPGPG